MIRIAEYISPDPSPVWKLAKQAGVDIAVGGLPFDMLRGDERVCDLAPLTRMKQRYEEAGFELAVIEARPPLNKAKRGLEGRDEEIDVACALIENMGKLGIPVWCYEWMTDFNWVRTNMATPSRGGSVVTSFDLNDVPEDLAKGPPISEEELWVNLEYFLSRPEAVVVIEAFRRHYNEVRPHSSLGYLTPQQFKQKQSPKQSTCERASSTELMVH